MLADLSALVVLRVKVFGLVVERSETVTPTWRLRLSVDKAA